MPSEGVTFTAETRSLSDLLGEFELSGQTWCYADLAGEGGFSVPHGEAVMFHAVLHGSVRLALPGATVEVGAGEAVAVLSGEAHALRAAAGNETVPLEFLRREQGADIPSTFALGAAGSVVARVLSGRLSVTLPAGASRASLPGLLRLGPATNSAWGSLLKPDALALAGIGLGAAALLTRLAATMIVAQLRTDPRCCQMFSPDKRDPIGQALRLIAGNPSANWTVERLARSVGMGRSNFAAHFTAQVGRAPMEVVAEQRMEHAAQLLRKSKLKIAEISELSGYGSEAAFSRRFTRNFGISPSQMREQARMTQATQRVEQSRVLLLSGPRQKRSAAKSEPDRKGGRQRPVAAARPARTIIFSARPE